MYFDHGRPHLDPTQLCSLYFWRCMALQVSIEGPHPATYGELYYQACHSCWKYSSWSANCPKLKWKLVWLFLNQAGDMSTNATLEFLTAVGSCSKANANIDLVDFNQVLALRGLFWLRSTDSFYYHHATVQTSSGNSNAHLWEKLTRGQGLGSFKQIAAIKILCPSRMYTTSSPTWGI